MAGRHTAVPDVGLWGCARQAGIEEPGACPRKFGPDHVPAAGNSVRWRAAAAAWIVTGGALVNGRRRCVGLGVCGGA